MSTFLNTGNILSAVLFLLTVSSEVLVNSDSFLSEKPIDFILLNSLKFFGKPVFLIFFSPPTPGQIPGQKPGQKREKGDLLF